MPKLKHIDFGEEFVGSMAIGAVACLIAAKRAQDTGNAAWDFGESISFEGLKERCGFNQHTVSSVPVYQTPFSVAVGIDERVDEWFEKRDGTKKIASIFAPASVAEPEPTPEPIAPTED